METDVRATATTDVDKTTAFAHSPVRDADRSLSQDVEALSWTVLWNLAARERKDSRTETETGMLPGSGDRAVEQDK